ncbi:ankyrin repeat-containing protein (plasmid) [Rhizobium gallicum]|uniref:Ankyrin repeat-containing protein n=1 Tax=Rhizobium gallicum TaxID=56730 RepID=A0A1L5NVW0_9HYPH|nr:ankyrin repeat domain-containing protein [Rhizobium gallicum]APO72030.1 ankyrin repeat-containing protein [Rhizobium gallicum]
MANFFAELRTNPNFDPHMIPDFTEISEDNRSYLQEAIAYRPEHAESILQADVPLDHQDGNGQTALQYAISRGMYDLATDIVNKGADLRRLDKYGNDALWTAVLNPRPSLPLIDLLVTKGADPHRKNTAGRSSADMAVTKKNQAMMTLFGL